MEITHDNAFEELFRRALWCLGKHYDPMVSDEIQARTAVIWSLGLGNVGNCRITKNQFADKRNRRLFQYSWVHVMHLVRQCDPIAQRIADEILPEEEMMQPGNDFTDEFIEIIAAYMRDMPEGLAIAMLDLRYTVPDFPVLETDDDGRGPG